MKELGEVNVGSLRGRGRHGAQIRLLRAMGRLCMKDRWRGIILL